MTRMSTPNHRTPTNPAMTQQVKSRIHWRGVVDPKRSSYHMKLSELDMRVVRRLQKNGRAWRWVRWFTLVGSIGSIVQCAVVIMELLKQSTESSGRSDVIAVLSPLCWMLLCLSSVMLGYTLVFWGGDPKARLLLRLLEDHESDAEPIGLQRTPQ